VALEPRVADQRDRGRTGRRDLPADQERECRVERGEIARERAQLVGVRVGDDPHAVRLDRVPAVERRQRQARSGAAERAQRDQRERAARSDPAQSASGR
jgi:hypothetical protein